MERVWLSGVVKRRFVDFDRETPAAAAVSSDVERRVALEGNELSE